MGQPHASQLPTKTMHRSRRHAHGTAKESMAHFYKIADTDAKVKVIHPSPNFAVLKK
jgi:hypothetical protein